MDAKISSRIWSDPDLDASPPEIRLTMHWMTTNPDRNDCGAYRFSPARFAFQTGLDAVWHQKTIAAIPGRIVQDGHWFLYVPFISEYLQLVVVGKTGGLNNVAQALAKPFQALPKPLQSALASAYPELTTVWSNSEALGKPLASPSRPVNIGSTASPPTENDDGSGRAYQAQAQNRAAQNSIAQGESEGGPPIGAEVPDEPAVITWAATWPGDLARGIPAGIPDAYALSWLAFRASPKAGPFPKKWQDDLRRRYTADWLNNRIGTRPAPAASADKATLRLNLARETDPDKKNQIRALLAKCEN